MHFVQADQRIGCCLFSTQRRLDSKMYMVDFILPNNIAVKHINVLGAYPSSTDVLIGMDIIGLGDFAVTNYLNQTSFTFRVPSAERMDFTKA
jgi:hypothetical protein